MKPNYIEYYYRYGTFSGIIKAVDLNHARNLLKEYFGCNELSGLHICENDD